MRTSWVGVRSTAWGAACAVALAAHAGGVAPTQCNSETEWRVEVRGASLEGQADGVSIPRVPHGVHMNEAGEPDLPFLVELVPVLRDCDAEIVVERVESHETNGVQIAARGGYSIGEDANGNPCVVPVAADPSAVYQRDAWWPAQPLEVSYAVQGKQRWARFVFHPFQYNPVRGILRFNDRMDARLIWRSTKDSGRDEVD